MKYLPKGATEVSSADIYLILYNITIQRKEETVDKSCFCE